MIGKHFHSFLCAHFTLYQKTIDILVNDHFIILVIGLSISLHLLLLIVILPVKLFDDLEGLVKHRILPLVGPPSDMVSTPWTLIDLADRSPVFGDPLVLHEEIHVVDVLEPRRESIKKKVVDKITKLIIIMILNVCLSVEKKALTCGLCVLLLIFRLLLFFH